MRGCFAFVPFFAMTGDLLGLWDVPLTGRICVSMFFVANGIFSLKYEEMVDNEDKKEKMPAYVSLIGGVILLLFTLSSIILATFSISLEDVGGYLFAPILIIIGVFQVQGGVKIMPDLGHKLLAQSSLVLGVMEVLLGIAVLIYQHGPGEAWQVRLIVTVWLAFMIPTMFATAYHWERKLEAAQEIQPVSQK